MASVVLACNLPFIKDGRVGRFAFILSTRRELANRNATSEEFAGFPELACQDTHTALEGAMYTMMRDGLSLETAKLELPSLLITILIAESMYKFHSFTLEFLAALATWTVIDAGLSLVARAFRLVGSERQGVERRQAP